MTVATKRRSVVKVDRVECDAVRVPDPDAPPETGFRLVADETTHRGLLLVFAGAPGGVAQPFACFRTDEEGFARLIAAAPIARAVVGNAAAARWLVERMKLGTGPAATPSAGGR